MRMVQVNALRFALLGNGVQLGDEDGSEEDPGDCHNGDGGCWVVILNRGEIADQTPGGENGHNNRGGACNPLAFIEVPLDLEDGDAVEESQKQEGNGVEMQQEEAVLRHPAHRVPVDHRDTQGATCYVPLSSDDHLDKDHEDEADHLIDLGYCASEADRNQRPQLH